MVTKNIYISEHEMSNVDVVLACYTPLGENLLKPWFRIVFDEGHKAKNIDTKCISEILKLDAERRWILTGTPI